MNNIFKYATKELSQDAFLCWSINWLAEEKTHPMYSYGKAMLDLFLADQKQEHYYDVEVCTQYDKIDVLVLFKDKNKNSHALIIEDKTNTSEHSNQMLRYKDKLLQNLHKDEKLMKYASPEVHLVYIKTGIMYDKDVLMVGKGAVVVDLDALLEVTFYFSKQNNSEILSSFNAYIQDIKSKRVEIENQIEHGDFDLALQNNYGQFYLLDKIFSTREKAKFLGNYYVEHDKNEAIFIDNIYAGTNRDGTPWIQYCFWGSKYPKNYYSEANINEYHYLFWRLDCNWKKDDASSINKWTPQHYIALRHYDERAHSKESYLNERKRFVYKRFRTIADNEYNKNPEFFSKVGKRENYKESDLLFIPITNIQHMSLNEIKGLLSRITDAFMMQPDELYLGMDDVLASAN